MGANNSSALSDIDIKEIEEETGFTKRQIDRLYARFQSLDRTGCGTLSRDDLYRIPEIAINPVGGRIVNAFFTVTSPTASNSTSSVYSRETEDGRFVRGTGVAGKYEDGRERSVQLERLGFRQFVRVLAHFRPVKKNRPTKLNSREQKLRFTFKLYDLDDDDLISKEELLNMLQLMIGMNISEEQLNSIAERTIYEADDDKDQMISFNEFYKVLSRTEVEQKMSIRFLN